MTQKPETIDAYIATFTKEVQERLNSIRILLKETLPEAKEKISWGMPTYWQRKNIIHFAAYKNHIGVYPGSDAISHFAARLDENGYAYSKGAIQFPYKNDIDLPLIKEIALWNLKAVQG